MAKQPRNTRNTRVGGKTNKFNQNTNLKANQKFKSRRRPIKMNAKVLQDARQKLMHKKRPVMVTDARDVLTRKMRIQDARSKINNNRNNPSAIQQSPKVKVIGTNIVQKVDRNGKMSLMTTKSRNTNEINLMIKKQLGLVAPAARSSALKRSPLSRKPQHQFNKPSSPLKKIIHNNNNNNNGPPMRRHYSVESTDFNNSDLYKWMKPDLRPASRLIGSLDPANQAIRDFMRERMITANREWENMVNPRRYADLDYVVDEDMEMMELPVSRIALKGSSRVSNIHSRLDNRLPMESSSHGILSRPKTTVVVPAGHRIVVSNLQSTVTEEDIKELFEDIGQLLSAKLVRPGVAEVIYKNLKDAQKAVDTYHNRQLDGQPMKCLLVNKRPLNPSTGAVSKHGSDKLIPDISTIHKVLFQKN